MSDVRRLLVSFSGGRTSGYMTRRILETWQDRYDEIVVLFANTGQEHEKTLEFVHNCDKHFGFNTVWLESIVIPEKGKGCKANVVDYKSANRDGSHFEQAVKKYGIFNAAYPNCTDRLKVMPMRDYARSIGWKAKTYDTAIGIRVDEIDRMSPKAQEMRVIYPLVSWNVTREQILGWWAGQVFDLGLEELMGNCKWCWKKSDKKLFTIAKEHPEYFDFPARMERDHSEAGGDNRTENVFFREFKSAADIIAKSQEPFTPWTPPDAHKQKGLFSLDEMDYSNGCSDSCEVEYI